ncbi:hypothetical protein GYB61_07155 [bacterium]|nr:hypothetical protein [bacterium]
MSDPYAPQSLIPGTNGLSLTQLWAMLWARKWLIIAIGAIVVALTLVLTLLQEKRYEARGTLLLDYKVSDPTLLQGFSANLELSYLKTQAQLLTSRPIMLSALRALGIDRDAEYVSKFRALDARAGSYEDWLVSQFLDDISVSTDADSRLIDLICEQADPTRAAAIVNAIIDAYMDGGSSFGQGTSERQASPFEQQVLDARIAVDNAQARLTQYQQSEQLVEISDRVNTQQDRLRDLTQRYVAAQSDRQDAEARVNQLKRLRASGVSLNRQLESIGDTQNRIGNLRGELAQLEARRSDMQRSLGPNHPTRQALDAEISSLRGELNAQVRSAVSALEGQVELARTREQDLESRLEAQRQVVLALEEKNNKLESLKRELQVAQSRYDAAVSRYDRVAVGAQSTASGASVLSRAVPPTKASSPNAMLNLVAGFILGGMLALAVAMALELLRRRVRVGEDIEREFGMPVLAQVVTS